MKKKIIFAVIIVLVLTVAVSLVLSYRSELIIHAYEENGFTVTEIDMSDKEVQLKQAFGYSEERIEKASEFKIYYLNIPDDYTPGDAFISSNRGFLIVCPSSKEAKEFLQMSDDGLYEEMKENKTIKGNLLLFTHSISMRETFNDYLIENFVSLFI